LVVCTNKQTNILTYVAATNVKKLFAMEEGESDFIIDIAETFKSDILIPTNLGPQHIFTTRSFESIIQVIQKIHNDLRPFVWLHFDPLNKNILTTTCLYMSYKIYIYFDLESDMYIVDLINVNMIDSVFSRVWIELKTKM